MGILSGKFIKNVLCRVVYTGNAQDVDTVAALTYGNRKSPIEISFSSDIFFMGKIMEALPSTVMDKGLSYWYEENSGIEYRLMGRTTLERFLEIRKSCILILDRAYKLPILPEATVICPSHKAQCYAKALKYGNWYNNRTTFITDQCIILDEVSTLMSRTTYDRLKDYLQRTGKDIIFLVYDRDFMKNHEVLWRMLNLLQPYRFSNYKTFLDMFYECYGTSGCRKVTGIKNETSLYEYIESWVFNVIGKEKNPRIVYNVDMAPSMEKTYNEVVARIPEGAEKAKDYLLNFLEYPKQYGYEWVSMKEIILNNLVDSLMDTGQSVLVVTNGHNEARRLRREIFKNKYTIWQADKFMNTGFNTFILKQQRQSEEKGVAIMDAEVFGTMGKNVHVDTVVFLSPVGELEYCQNIYLVYNNAYDKEVLKKNVV